LQELLNKGTCDLRVLGQTLNELSQALETFKATTVSSSFGLFGTGEATVNDRTFIAHAETSLRDVRLLNCC
jgi:hypothetical protein